MSTAAPNHAPQAPDAPPSGGRSAVTPHALRLFGIAVLLATPILFSCNAIIGRFTVGHVAPWTFACLRWTLAVALLSPFVWRDVVARRHALLAHWRLIVLLGFLGMWISGGVFYSALHVTTATNGTLIYTATPLIIVLLERAFRGRPIAWREMLGILLASLGIGAIVTHGSLAALLTLDLNVGDFAVLCCTVAWATYTVILRRGELAALPVPVVFFGAAACGAAMLWPAMMVEIAFTASFPSGPAEWASIATAAVFASILAFLGYQYVVKAFGSAVAGLSMYLTPISGVGLAVLVLGERPDGAVAVGSVLVILGVVLATAPVGWLARLPIRR